MEIDREALEGIFGFFQVAINLWFILLTSTTLLCGQTVDGRLSYQSSYGFASGQIPHRSQGTLLPSSGEPKVSNPWNNVQHKDSI
jgi:hypothetical protein